jgi:hypothetical protein
VYVGACDQHVDGIDLGGLGLDLWRRWRSACQHGGHATGCDGDRQNYNTRRFHTLALNHSGRTSRLIHMAAKTAAYTGFHQLKVKVWLSSGD